VRESDAFKVAVGQDISFTVPANPDHAYSGKINYVSAALDPTTHRLAVRATVQNPSGQLKPEMFASVSIFSDTQSYSVAVPRAALIFEGSTVRVWVAHEDKSIELRLIKTGLISGRMIQVVEGLAAVEQVVTRGSLFIDRAAVGG
jgi:cobalt-zinc-cadmium efflux system membrane fusion protein